MFYSLALGWPLTPSKLETILSIASIIKSFLFFRKDQWRLGDPDRRSSYPPWESSSDIKLHLSDQLFSFYILVCAVSKQRAWVPPEKFRKPGDEQQRFSGQSCQEWQFLPSGETLGTAVGLCRVLLRSERHSGRDCSDSPAQTPGAAGGAWVWAALGGGVIFCPQGSTLEPCSM